jgi:hypothetical protein
MSVLKITKRTLLAEAFNVHIETGLTPRQLLGQCEKLRAEADIARAQVEAWNGAVYVENMPMRAIPDTDQGDKVPPIPYVTPKRLTALLNENKCLKGEGGPTAQLLDENKRFREVLTRLVERCASGDFYSDYDADWSLVCAARAALKRSEQ